MHAARFGHLGIVRYLAEKGADVNKTDYSVGVFNRDTRYSYIHILLVIETCLPAY